MRTRIACALVAAAVAAGAGVLESTASGGVPSGTCAAGSLPLSARDLPAARAAVSRFVAGPWRKASSGLDVRGATSRAALAPSTVRGGYAKVKCGRTVWRRTAVVFVRLPKMAWSASLSSPVFYASRTSYGWVVWFQIH